MLKKWKTIKKYSEEKKNNKINIKNTMHLFITKTKRVIKLLDIHPCLQLLFSTIM